jgi:hypothetical protein
LGRTPGIYGSISRRLEYTLTIYDSLCHIDNSGEKRVDMRKGDQAELALEHTLTTSSFDSANNTPVERHIYMHQAIDRVGQRVLL